MTTDRLIQILEWFKEHGIKSIDKAIKQTEKNNLAYTFPTQVIKFKGNSIINDVVHTKLRIIDNDIELTGLEKITYSKRFNEVTFHYVSGEKKKIKGEKPLFNLVNLCGYDLFQILNT